MLLTVSEYSNLNVQHFSIEAGKMYAIFKDGIIEKAKETYNQHLKFEAGEISLKQLHTLQ
nr:hypothetical protein [Erwinia amylovora]